MIRSLNVSAVKTYGAMVRHYKQEQPTIPDDSHLVAVLKTKGKKTEFVVDVTGLGMYETATYSLTAGINTSMELYLLRRADLEKCTVE